MTVDEFIAFFEAIPEEKWCVGHFAQGETSCALGHLARAASIGPDKANDLVWLFLNYGIDWPTRVNDGLVKQCNQPTPKQRILAALHWIKEQQG